MFAEYIIKMTLDNGDSFAIGMGTGIIIVTFLYLLVDYMEKK